MIFILICKDAEFIHNQVKRISGAISFYENISGIQIRDRHIQIDNIVLDTIYWSNEVGLLHDFFELDYSPKYNHIRITINLDARCEILKPLLALNQQIQIQEIADGL